MWGSWQDGENPPMMYFSLLLGHNTGVLKDALAQLSTNINGPSTMRNACDQSEPQGRQGQLRIVVGS